MMVYQNLKILQEKIENAILAAARGLESNS
ncbi:hypothetical protein AVDCRST_MAG84-1346 [uncultured Microcoleus sp.]|uniref:Uncharacterized protein n=1 Tax=uncultured Microcoleus sp. TaxID=259945 RepID=A0A6J4L2C3_9CYAN|nr:hypothetical protein AVDCRST_MAG84-1346 [uncultured Microcoleus sp.]